MRETMDVLQSMLGRVTFIICGICSAMATASAVVRDDPRIAGLILINPEIPSSLTRPAELKMPARYYWRHALFSLASWLRLVSGRSHYSKALSAVLTEFCRGSNATKQQPLPTAGRLPYGANRETQLLLVFSEWEFSEDGVRLIQAACDDRCSLLTETHVVNGTDHVFTTLASQRELLDLVAHWMTKLWPVSGVAPKCRPCATGARAVP
jgi:pimeloyl-ACP methyl ester carboxylesterase